MSAVARLRVPGTRSVLLLSALLGSACGAKTDVLLPGDEDAGDSEAEARVDLPPAARCIDSEMWTSPGKYTVVHGGGTDREGPVSYVWALLSSPPGSASAVSPLHTPNTTFTPDALGDYMLKLIVTDRLGQTDECDSLVHSVNGPPEALCPPAVEAAPIGAPVTLEGDGEDDGGIVAFEWSVQEKPEGSAPSLAPTDAPTTVFTPDLVGTYEIRFTVTDDRGFRDYCVVLVNATGGPALDCPDDPISSPTRRPVTLSIPVIGGESVTWRWELLDRPATSTATPPAPADSATPGFTPDKPGRYVIRGIATNSTGLSSYCDIVLEATPSGPDAVCPADASTVPLTPITLTGGGVDDGVIVGYLWELVEQPAGSSASPPSPETSREVTFMADVAGAYAIRLTVRDDDGNAGSCTFTVTAVPSEGMRIELYWNPPNRSCADDPRPGCDPTDVDLHLLHQSAAHWFDTGDESRPGLDCYYANCTGWRLRWDASGNEDDPRLDLDDTDGFGPENINIDLPVTGNDYTVGVHYFSDDGYGPVPAYVQIYCSTVSADPVAQFGPVTLTRSATDFWRVARIRWTGATCTVTSLAHADGTPDIITREEAERAP